MLVYDDGHRSKITMLHKGSDFILQIGLQSTKNPVKEMLSTWTINKKT